MTQIYNLNLWGGKTHDFYSGEGSHNKEIINPYLNSVIDFLKNFKDPITVCDLGCGDFNIGKNIVAYSKHYIAIDIVDALIKRNKKLFKIKNLEFKCLDISTDNLPDADCVILRQVLQHLSNNEIERITKKLQKYKYIILTEHIPFGNFTPNIDIISGQGNRIKKNSGVNLLEPPFNLKIKKEIQLCEHVLKNNKGRIATLVFKV
ncbi:class I SAM-dependent methyltransferase [Neotamlana laminarinivorans]|uniref:Class I SAM-dependent methyltransferase n=1 Tax=Neotamlana laminarinivorans TaxID=2883124 RepID=A0A9X1I3V3_9FLAO|nr:methyltransferase domain-containing protein [Tamlana laminarinivorans]MCB4799927.1 class I SAM-dependent methyltransferase [Tamlana laminarinivorans]